MASSAVVFAVVFAAAAGTDCHMDSRSFVVAADRRGSKKFAVAAMAVAVHKDYFVALVEAVAG